MSATLSTPEPTCLQAEAAWQADLAADNAATHSLQGQHLRTTTATFRRGETVEAEAGVAGEEVATILAGEFRIDAAGETYELGVGEGIVIPPAAERRWTCLSPNGALYRVLVLPPAQQAVAPEHP